MTFHPCRFGTAGWSIPAALAGEFNGDGTQLQRFAQRMNCTEINSSFYRPHRAATYEKWAASTPADFRFSVKIPRTLTHEGKLLPQRDLLLSFLDGLRGLGEKLGPLLAQLPPKLAFDPNRANDFFSLLRALHDGAIVVEPRHVSWFAPAADELLRALRVSRVAADPSCTPAAAKPGGNPSMVYYRLHGSPRIYYSAYVGDYLADLALSLQSAASTGATVWCIFDNTASGAALENALQLQRNLSAAPFLEWNRA